MNQASEIRTVEAVDLVYSSSTRSRHESCSLLSAQNRSIEYSRKRSVPTGQCLKIARLRANKMLCASLGPQALALRSLNQQPLSSYLLSKVRYPGANYENFADLQLRLFIGGKPEQESASLMSRPMEITTRNPTNPTRIGLCTSFALHRSSHKRSATEGHSKSSH